MLQLLIVVICGVCIAERVEAVKDLERQIEELISSRNIDVSKALAQQTEEIDFLKAELTSTKVRLHDALSHSQAEKDALIRHADASRTELLQQLEKVRRDYCPQGDTEMQSAVADSVESSHIALSKCHSVEALCNEHMSDKEPVRYNTDNNGNLWNKLELLRELVKAEKEKWNLQRASASDSQQLNADTPDGTADEAAHSHKIRSSWVVLEEQVLPLIEKFCTAVDQDNGPSNSETVKNGGSTVENREYGTLPGDGDGNISEEDTLQSLREQVEEERREVIHLKEVINKMQDSVHIKDKAVHEMETKCGELQKELDSVREQLRSQEKLTEDLSANVESVSEQLNHRTAELSDKDTNIQKLNANIAELNEQIMQKLLVLQTDCNERLDSERKTWQAQIDAKTDELLAKHAELEQHELTLKGLNDQCGTMRAELDAKTAEILNNNTQIDSLTREISAAKQQLNYKTVELHEAQMRVEHENKLLKDETECETLVLKSKITEMEDEIAALQEQLESKNIDLDSERKTWQAQIGAKTDELLAKHAELEQHELTFKALNDQCSTMRAELDEKTAEVVNNNTQIDSLTREISVVKQQLNDKTVELHEAQTRIEHEKKLLKDETECETVVLKSKITEMEDEIRTLKEQLESKKIDLVNKDEALIVLENRSVSEREEFQAQIASLEHQLSGNQTLLVEQLDVLTKEVKTKDAAIREQEEAHAAYCKLTDAKLSELSAAVIAKEDEMKSTLEQHKTELMEQRDIFTDETAKLTKTNEEQLALLHSQVCQSTKNKDDLESELQSLTDKLKSESEKVVQLEKQITELSLVKVEYERQLEALRCTMTDETEHVIKLRDEEIAALKSALSDKDHSLSLLNAALSQTCREDIQSVDSSSHTVVTSSNDGSKDSEVLDAGSGDAVEPCGEQVLGAEKHDVPMMVQQIKSLGAMNTMLQEKIARLEADLLQLKQTDVKPPVGESESPESELARPAYSSG